MAPARHIKLVVNLKGVGVGVTLFLPSVHGIGASKVLKLVVDLEGIGVGLTLVLPSVHGMGPSKVCKLLLTLRKLMSVPPSSSPVCMAWMPSSIATVLLPGARQLLTNWFGLALKQWVCH